MQGPNELFLHYAQRLSQLEKDHYPDLMSEIEADLKLFLQQKQQEFEAQYKEIGLHPEGAMDWLEIAQSVYLFEKLKENYRDRFETENGTDAILNQIIDFILEQGQQNHLTLEDREYDPTNPKEIQILKNALRCLLDEANDTEFPNYINPSAPLVFGAGKRFSARDMLAYHWLAATDTSLSDQSQLNEKMNIVFYLSDIRRAHNGELNFHALDDPIDDTSCAPGVIGRMGHMHIDNPLTSIKEISLSTNIFAARYPVLIIEAFKKLPPLNQMSLVNTWYHKATTLDEDENYVQFTNFTLSLLTEDNLKIYIALLEEEFGALDDVSKNIAILTFFREGLKNTKQMQGNLIERLDQLAKQSILEYLKANTELIKIPTVSELYTQLREILTTMRHQLSLEELKTCLTLEQQLLEKIEQIAISVFQNRLADLEREYKSSKGPKATFIPVEQLADSSPLPYWYQKLQLNLEEADFSAKMQFVPPLILSKPSFKKPITANEETFARDYIMMHARSPEELDLGDLLHPESLVQFTFPNTNQIRVHFIDIFHNNAAQYRDLPIETIKSYAQMQKKFEEALARPEDILLQHFTILKKIGERGKIFRKLYIKQLHEAQVNNRPLFDAAVGFQSSEDLLAIKNSLQNEFDDLNIHLDLEQQPEQISENLQDQLAQVYISKPYRSKTT